MKRKELAEYIDRMGDSISDIDVVPRVLVGGDSDHARAVSEAVPTEREVECLRAGAIAALCEVFDLLTGEIEPTDPDKHAEDMIIDTISVIIDRRVKMALRELSND